MTKAIHEERTAALDVPEEPATKFGPNWILSRRGILTIYFDRLTCGDWIVRYDEIESAVLYSIPYFGVIPCYLLVVETENDVLRFGLNGWNSFWKGELPFPVRREKGVIGYTVSSIVLRLFILAVIIHWLVTEFMK